MGPDSNKRPSAGLPLCPNRDETHQPYGLSTANWDLSREHLNDQVQCWRLTCIDPRRYGTSHYGILAIRPVDLSLALACCMVTYMIPPPMQASSGDRRWQSWDPTDQQEGQEPRVSCRGRQQRRQEDHSEPVHRQGLAGARIQSCDPITS